jgi:hypothetical protein
VIPYAVLEEAQNATMACMNRKRKRKKEGRTVFKMSLVVGPQFKTIVNERQAAHRARANRAIATVRGLTTKGKLNTPGVVRNHATAAAAMQDTRRWEAIERRVSR